METIGCLVDPAGSIRNLLHGMRDDGQVKQFGSHPRYKYTPNDNGNDGNDRNGANLAYLSRSWDNVTDVTVVTEGRGSVGNGRRLTEVEARKVQRLIREGTKPEIARREVLGE